MNLTVTNYGELKDSQRKVAFVLTGGGTRGSFQVGFMKAAIEYGFFPDIITGTSIGALNGVAFVQGVFDYLEDLWDNMSFATLFGDTGVNNIKIDDSIAFIRFFYGWIFNQRDKSGKLLALGKSIGTYPDGLEKAVKNKLDEEVVKSSPIDFVVNTTLVHKEGEGFTRFQEMSLSKNEIPSGQLADFIVASSTFFPFMAAKQIGPNIYVDGGITNNYPLEPALERGANDIIVVHVGGIGIDQNRRKLNLLKCAEDVRVMKLSPHVNIGSVSAFNNKYIINKGIAAGYDAGREFFDEYLKTINPETKKMV